jgi:hypothetical protein
LVVFDGQGRFALSSIQAVAAPPPPAHDTTQQPAAAIKSDIDAPFAQATETKALKSPMLRLRHLCRVLFLRKDSAKNLMIHLLIALLFVCESSAALYSKNIIFARGIYYFEDTSLNDIFSFVFAIVVVSAVVQTISNSLIAYVSVRTRKNLCRELHNLYFQGNT